jgi:hypothetical protein
VHLSWVNSGGSATCMKRKFIMMPALILGPKQPGNDIDVYLRPLVEELLLLWHEEGVQMWDEYR